MKDDSLEPIFTALITHVGWWHSLIVRFCHESSIDKVVSAFNSLAVPNLIHFGAYLQENDHELFITLAFTQFIFTGCTSCLSFFECVDVSMECFWPPLGAVTNLRLLVSPSAWLLTGDHFKDLLMSASAVERLQIRGNIVNPDDQVDLSSVSLPHLLQLRIGLCWDQSCIDPCYFEVSCPALTTIMLGTMIIESTEAFVNCLLDAAVQPKYLALTTLEFKFANCIELDEDFITVLLTITHLSFTSCNYVDHVLDLIIECYDNAWPRLHTLTISSFRSKWIQPLWDFVAQRIDMGLPLKCVKLSEVEGDVWGDNTFLRDHVLLEVN